MNVTVPVGVKPETLLATVAVSVNATPPWDDCTESVSVVVELTRVKVWDSATDTLFAKLFVPAYDAVIE
jgi:hypothetical protein